MNLTVFLFWFCVIFLSQAYSSLLDPTLIGNELRKFARDALGVDDMQVYFNGLQYQEKMMDGEDITQALAIRLADKFKTRFKVAERLKTAVEASYLRAGEPRPTKQCCEADKSKLRYDVRFRSKVDLNNICLKVSGTASRSPVLLDEGVFREMKQISETYPFIKWQYFGSEEGVMTNFPVYDDTEECSRYDPRYRPFYVETATPEAKDVVLVIDTSGSMVGDKLHIAREAANTVLETLNPKDQVGIVSFGDTASTPGLKSGKSACYSERLALAIPANIRCMRNYVSSLNPHGQTKYRLAFEKAFSLLKASSADDTGKPKKRVILFLTDGAPSDNENPGLIFQTIRDNNLELNNSVIILTFGFGGVDEKTKEILQDIAKQNTTKYHVPANTTVGDIRMGTFTPVQEIKTLRSKIATYYNLFASARQLDRPIVSVPYVDAFGTGLLMSITLPCFHKGRFIGVTGTDINIDDLISDISLFNQGKSAYAFMTSRQGRAIVHPLMSAPSGAYEDPVYLDIRTLEPHPEFDDVFASMAIRKTGSKTFVSKRFLPRAGSEKEGVRVRSVNSTYFWTPLESTDFSLGVVVPVGYRKDELATLQIPEGYKFKYHRIDLDPPAKPCSHFGLLAAGDSTVVKFAPETFKDRYKYIGLDETKADVDLMNAYMNDKTGSVKNPGLKEGIRETVVATWKVEDLWLRDKTELTQYLVWRFIGTADGVFRITPGSLSEKSYDPRQRPWYYTALANTGLISLTTPYLDAEGPNDRGAGVVITAAKSLYLGEPNREHHTNDDVLGVMGADFSLTYFYRLLIELYPLCKERQTYSCFVMDNAGFLIMHEDFLLSSATASEVEYVHITEKEKAIAEHLISGGYLKRKECRNLKEIRKQSFYEVDLPDGFVDLLKTGSSCSKYQLSHVSGTNAYIGVAVRESFCAAESCSCSFDNKCSYLSPKCECPCTSPLEFNYCRSQFPNSSLPICPPSVTDIEAPSNPSPPIPRTKCEKPSLEKCFDPHCSERNSSQTCEGIVSCFWCQYNKDDVPLKKPYCANSEVCFRGKEAAEKPDCGVTNQLSTQSPHKDGRLGTLSTGAAAGLICGIIVFVTVLVFAFVLIKRHLRNSRFPSEEDTSDPKNRPPAPLPGRGVEYVPEEEYEDPDKLEMSREGSVASIQWPSPYEEIRVRPSNKRPSIPPQERGPSNGRAHVIPPPPRPTQSSSGGVEPYGGTPPPTLPQAYNTPPPSDPPYSSVSRVGSSGVGQPPVPNTQRVPDVAGAQSLSRTTSGGNPQYPQPREISVSNLPPLYHISNTGSPNTVFTTPSIDGEPPQLPEKFKTRGVNGLKSPPIIISGEEDTFSSDNQLHATEVNRAFNNDASPSFNGTQSADRMAYYNVSPPLPEPRKDADGYMKPSTLRPQLTSKDSSTSLDSNGYLKCFA